MTMNGEARKKFTSVSKVQVRILKGRTQKKIGSGRVVEDKNEKENEKGVK